MVYLHNLESDRLELHLTEEEYQKLTPEQRGKLRSAYLWSKARQAWVSRSWYNNAWAALTLAVELGAENGGEVGERLSFAERVEARTERAAARAERHLEAAERAKARAETLQAEFNHHRGDIAFMTQPIILGHSGSERFKRYVDRVVRRYEKGFEELQKADYHEHRAAVAAETAEQKRLKDPAFLARRIAEAEAELRHLERNGRQGEEYYREVSERLSFYRERLAELGGIRFSRENVRAGDRVKIRGVWCVVKRANSTTVTVVFGGWETRFPYAEIQEHRGDGHGQGETASGGDDEAGA